MFAIFVGVGHLLGFALFPPQFSKQWTRRLLYPGSMVAFIAAYVLFFAAAFITVRMIGFQADRWSAAVKAMNTEIVSATVIIAGINTTNSAADVTPGGLLTLEGLDDDHPRGELVED